MIRFFAIERTAAHEIISGRTLQSIEFQRGRLLSEVLQQGSTAISLGPRLAIVFDEQGMFIISTGQRVQDYVVFDLDTCDLFGPPHTPASSLLYFHKCLRFCLKVWENQRPSSSERFLPGSAKSIIFPYPISQKTEFRISIDTAPDADRQGKRTNEGRSFLVYKSGNDEGAGPNEVASVTNFRRFLEVRRRLQASFPRETVAASQPITSLIVTELQDPASKGSLFQGYEQWLPQLTEKQQSFVMSELTAPHRIEGPAGTGKTISLVLKAIASLQYAESNHLARRVLFVTHSESTRRTIEQIFVANGAEQYMENDSTDKPISLKLTTLHSLCGELLRRDISDTELIDRDAMESKQMQMLYVAEALESSMLNEYSTFKKFLSDEFNAFLSNTDSGALADMLQHEISVIIKGRSDEKLDNYKKLPRLRYGLPVGTVDDRGFVWIIFRAYQDQLAKAAQFDTDDIVITTMGQLDTPIWRRRRDQEGYDEVYVDETHLFNINELSLFHHLTRSATKHAIAYSVDRSQAIGDRGWSSELFDNVISQEGNAEQKVTAMKGIFRSSADIINLALSVTSAGATLFTNFDDPLKMATSMLTSDEERRCSAPRLIEVANDNELIAMALSRAEELCREMQISKSGIAIITFSDDLFRLAEEFCRLHNKPVELLKQRGDIEVVDRANRTKRYILSTPEYVGGLEFEAVLLVGVDSGRVPPVKTLESIESANFLSYSAHNRLYVAITRARFRVEILINKGRGPSTLLQSAIEAKILLSE